MSCSAQLLASFQVLRFLSQGLALYSKRLTGKFHPSSAPWECWDCSVLHHIQLIAHIFEVKFFREMTHMGIMVYSKCLINIK